MHRVTASQGSRNCMVYLYRCIGMLYHDHLGPTDIGKVQCTESRPAKAILVLVSKEEQTVLLAVAQQRC